MSTYGLARRLDGIQSFQVMSLLARAQELESQGRSVVHMEIGEPDFPSPPAVVKAASRALEGGQTHYTPAVGLPLLREAISDYYRRRYQVTVAPERILVTPGASGALLLALALLVDPGDGVLLTDPGYPCNRHFVRFLGGIPQPVPVEAETDYQPTADMLSAYWAPTTVAALLGSPANPTGTLLSAQDLTATVAGIHDQGGRLILDEIYQGLVYDAPDETVLALTDEAFVVNSFSKYFGMTGWRLGWLVVPEGYGAPAERIAQNIFLAPSTPAQHAALAAFEPDTSALLEERRRAFQQRRDFLVPALMELGFKVEAPPQGAFYIYADCSALCEDSFSWAETLLEEVGVAVTPGADFGVHAPERHVRFAYTTSLDQLHEGVHRLRKTISSVS